MKIKSIAAYEILASGGYPTVECKVVLESGAVGIASVPYGASAGTHEATVLNDGDTARYNGKGALKAVANVNDVIAPELIGMSADAQRDIDNKMIAMDGTDNKAKLGGNAILAVSLAVAKAAAEEMKMPLFQHITHTFNTGATFEVLPNPMVVVIEGGKHADETTDLQEYCITGIGEGGPAENIRRAMESYHALGKVLKANKLSTNVGNEGAFAPNGIPSNESPFAYILEAIEKAGYKAGVDLGISIDAAASEFYKDGMYHLALENRSLTAAELSAYYESWMQKYPIITVEDMHHEDDWSAWVDFKKICDKHNVTLIGDDLTVTNVKRLQKAVDMEAISAILIKLNQIGSLTETVDTCMLAKQHGMYSVPSHRGGGETNDAVMVDLAVAVGGKFIKVGPSRGERVSKYNRLMEIERELRK
jgi:enolase